MKILEFNDLCKNENRTKTIKMSCFNLEYTKKHPEMANVGMIYASNTEGLVYEIDWNHHQNFTLGDYYSLLQDYNIGGNADILSIDVDDGNEIEFETVFITDDSIILV